MMACCESDPCHCTLYRGILHSEGDLLVGEHLPPNVARHRLYATYVHAVHVVLGRGNRVVVSSYIKDPIRDLFPDPQGEYMGHMPSEDTEDQGLI